jgi:cytochrome c553
MLINAPTEEALCLTCHGAASSGATTDVMTGVQYTLGATGLRGGTQLGALRNGGFDQARLDAGAPSRLAYLRSATAVSQRPKVGVGAAEDVTSAHIAMTENGLTNPGIAWGNGANGSGAGPAVTLSCASCHNPHGNGKYRILNTIPSPTGLTPVAAPGVSVTDASAPAAGDTRNYTVMQTKGTEGTESTYLLYSSQVVAAASAGTFNGIAGTYDATGGDYFHRNVPWNPQVNNAACDPAVFPAPAACATANDAPNGRPSTFSTEITAWCSACHTRYYADQNPNPDPAGTPATGPAWQFPRPGDAIYKYQHRTVPNRACVTCHVSHGSNAAMPGTFSSTQTMPNGVASASSRLLKIDNRGTCQACHDPTGTITAGQYFGPAPVVP